MFPAVKILMDNLPQHLYRGCGFNFLCQKEYFLDSGIKLVAANNRVKVLGLRGGEESAEFKVHNNINLVFISSYVCGFPYHATLICRFKNKEDIDNSLKEDWLCSH